MRASRRDSHCQQQSRWLTQRSIRLFATPTTSPNASPKIPVACPPVFSASRYTHDAPRRHQNPGGLHTGPFGFQLHHGGPVREFTSDFRFAQQADLFIKPNGWIRKRIHLRYWKQWRRYRACEAGSTQPMTSVRRSVFWPACERKSMPTWPTRRTS